MALPKPTEKSTAIASKKLIGEALVEMGLLTTDQVSEAVQRGVTKRMRLGELLVAEKVISEAQLAQALAIQYGLEYQDLTKFDPSEEAIKLMPEKVAKAGLILPVAIEDGYFVLAVYDPLQFVKFENLRRMITLPIRVRVGTKAGIEAALQKAYSGGSIEGMVELLARREQERRPVAVKPAASTQLSGQAKDGTPTIEGLVNKVLERALGDAASDIHIDPADGKVRVRMRIDGVLHEVHTYPVELHPSIVSRLKVLASLDIAEKRVPQDGRFHYVQGGRSVDLRVSTLPTVRGEKVVLRVLDRDRLKGSLREIGMSPEIAVEVQKLVYRPHGLLLITGPTGSGKTTTLYSMLSIINGLERNIITVEDPVEFKFDIVNQVQVNEKAGLGFAGVLRNILRQDPDIIMIGEIRDKDTAEIAVRASLTGHLVLSTLHTNDSVSTPGRLLDMGIEPFLLSSSLGAVIAQRLVRVLCTHCRQKRAITENELLLLGNNAISPGSAIFGPVGCEKCHQSGYKNRMPLFELMVIDPTLQRLIAERRPESELADHLAGSGFISMRQDGVFKVVAGLTSVEEVLKATF